MGWESLIPIGLNIIGGMMKSDTASDVAGIQTGAIQQGAQEATKKLDPWAGAGLPALERLQAGVAPGGEFAKPFTMQDALTSEAMKTALGTGMDAIQQSAAARGGLLSTNTLADLQKFGQKTGAQYEALAFDQAMRQQQAMLDPLKTILGISYPAAATQADIAGNAAMAIGGAQATGRQSRGDIWSDVLGQIAPGITKGFKGIGMGGGGTVSPDITSQAEMAADLFSDERMKEDIRPVGKTYDGENIYTYRMKGGGPKMMGVMAQELERTKPGAVRMHPSGYRMVDYDKVS